MRKKTPIMTQAYAEQLKQKREQAGSWGAIARLLADALRAWAVAGALFLAWRAFDLGFMAAISLRRAWRYLLENIDFDEAD